MCSFIERYTEDPNYNDSVCCQRFCCKIEFAVIKKLDRNPSKIKCSIKGLYFGSKNYTKELKTVKCTSFLGQTS